MDQLTRDTVYLLRDVLCEIDILRYTRPDNDPLLKDLHSKVAKLRRHLPHFDIHPGQPRHQHVRKG